MFHNGHGPELDLRDSLPDDSLIRGRGWLPGLQSPAQMSYLLPDECIEKQELPDGRAFRFHGLVGPGVEFRKLLTSEDAIVFDEIIQGVEGQNEIIEKVL